MNTPILTTKLQFPKLSSRIVLRSHLLERLNGGLARKLILVSAPAGFGKTTLVSEWARKCRHPAAWLSLEKGDNDPIRFLAQAQASGYLARVLEIHMLRALSAQAAEKAVVALDCLTEALTLAELSGFIRIFVGEGTPMAQLLYEAYARGIAPDYMRQLLAAFPAEADRLVRDG